MEPVNNKSAFKLRSGNKPSPMELSGVSPVKHVDSTTGEQITTENAAEFDHKKSSDDLRDMAAGNFTTGSLSNYSGMRSRMGQAGLRKV